MITCISNFSPTKTDVEKAVRCDGTVGGIASHSINQTISAQIRPGYAEKCEALNELNKQKGLDGDQHRIDTTKSCRESCERKATYQKIADINTQLETGAALMLDEDIEECVNFTCSVMLWPQLGGLSFDAAMMLPNFSQYTFLPSIPFFLPSLTHLFNHAPMPLTRK